MADEQQTTAAPPAWYAGFDEETRGHVMNKGWDKLEPAAAVAEIYKAYRGAEKVLGMPADEVARISKDPNHASWGELYKRLGKPDTAEGYDLSPLATADKPLDEKFVGAVREAALKANLPTGAALQMADAFLKYQAGQAQEAASAASFNATAEAERLKANWGANFETNKFIAGRAAEHLGVAPEAVAALEKIAGYAQTMETFRKLGVAMGEARFIQNGDTQRNGGVMSMDEAIAKKAELYRDQDFVARWGRGDAEARRMMNDLDMQIVRGKMAQRNG